MWVGRTSRQRVCVVWCVFVSVWVREWKPKLQSRGLMLTTCVCPTRGSGLRLHCLPRWGMAETEWEGGVGGTSGPGRWVSQLLHSPQPAVRWRKKRNQSSPWQCTVQPSSLSKEWPEKSEAGEDGRRRWFAVPSSLWKMKPIWWGRRIEHPTNYCCCKIISDSQSAHTALHSTSPDTVLIDCASATYSTYVNLKCQFLKG